MTFMFDIVLNFWYKKDLFSLLDRSFCKIFLMNIFQLVWMIETELKGLSSFNTTSATIASIKVLKLNRTYELFAIFLHQIILYPMAFVD